MNEGKSCIYSFDEFEVNLAERTLTRNGTEILLNNRMFSLLLVLIENRGHLITKNDLTNKVWEGQFIEESNLTVQISALRRALGENKNNPQYLKTVQGHGYRFDADVRTRPESEKEVLLQSENFKSVNLNEKKGTSETAGFEHVWVTKFFGSIYKNWKILIVAGIILTIFLISGSYLWRNGHRTTLAAQPNLSLKRLTASGKVNVAAISPNGKFFVYTQIQDGKTGVWLGHMDGSEPILLRPPEDVVSIQNFSFTNDGGSFYYILIDDKHPRGMLYKSLLFGGVPEEIREDISKAAFSPDGTHIAYVRNDEKDNQSALIISDLQSATEKPLAVHPLAERFNASGLAWSEDGSLISVAAGDGGQGNDIYIVSVSDGSLRRLTDSVWSVVHSAVWQTGQSGLIVVADEKDPGRGNWQLYQISYPDGKVRQLNADLSTYGSSLSLSADNKTLLTVQAQLVGNIWLSPATDAGKAKQITFGSLGRLDGWHGIDWTPDGKIVYTAVTGDTRTIWIMDADGSNQKQIIPNGGTNLYPSVTANGRLVIFQSDRDGKNAVWRASIDGGDMRRITETDIAAQPHVSPDGKWVVYITNTDSLGSLYRISIDGGEPIRLTERQAEWPNISPDSRSIACGYKIDGKEKLAIIPIEGGEPLKIFDIPKTANFRLGVHWTPDGKSVTYRDSAEGIWKQNIQGGEPEKLPGLPPEKVYAYNWSRDGKLFAYTRGREIRDAIIFSNFK